MCDPVEIGTCILFVKSKIRARFVFSELSNEARCILELRGVHFLFSSLWMCVRVSHYVGRMTTWVEGGGRQSNDRAWPVFGP
jgi:hypothetical protein